MFHEYDINFKLACGFLGEAFTRQPTAGANSPSRLT